jgi:hypothetical protein
LNFLGIPRAWLYWVKNVGNFENVKNLEILKNMGVYKNRKSAIGKSDLLTKNLNNEAM